jgi:hypothetical protein
MRLSGWNDIPDGYGARLDAAAAPAWLRLHPSWPAGAVGAVGGGWQLEPAGRTPPGAVAPLPPDEDGG